MPKIIAIALSIGTLGVASASATAATTGPSLVSSVPGEVHVNLNDASTHTLVVQDSIVMTRPGPTTYGPGALPLIGYTTAALRAAPNPWLKAAQVALTAGAAALQFVLQTGKEEDYEPQRVVIISELEGRTLKINPASDNHCRTVVRSSRGGTLPYTVACKILPSNTASDVQPAADLVSSYPRWPTPSLLVEGGRRFANRILVRQNDPAAFRTRMIWGGYANDTLIGSNFDDNLIGLVGNDSINGRAGDDWLIGLQGHMDLDAIIDDSSGEVENDSVPDDDKLYGGAGRDIVWGYRGNDLVSGGGGDDNQTVSIGRLTIPALYGGTGIDTVVGGDGVDRMEGGVNSDAILARESDFGGTDVADATADCGPNYEEPPTVAESYRASEVGGRTIDPIATCTRRISTPFSFEALRDWVPGSNWFWY